MAHSIRVGITANYLISVTWLLTPFVLLNINALFQKGGWGTYVSFAFATLISAIYTILSFSIQGWFVIGVLHPYFFIVVVLALFIVALIGASKAICRLSRSLMADNR
jgi:hypothetical protein